MLSGPAAGKLGLERSSEVSGRPRGSFPPPFRGCARRLPRRVPAARLDWSSVRRTWEAAPKAGPDPRRGPAWESRAALFSLRPVPPAGARRKHRLLANRTIRAEVAEGVDPLTIWELKQLHTFASRRRLSRGDFHPVWRI
jgi:hypothetical protein